MATSATPSNRQLDRHGLLLIGHGTCDEKGLAEFSQTTKGVANRLPHVVVQPCFLERASPTIADGVHGLASRGVRRVIVLPLLLFAARHAKRDIPAAVAEAANRYPSFETLYSEHLGCHEKVIALSEVRYRDAVTPFGPAEPDDSLLLLVGRGSRDEEATAEMIRVAELRRKQTPVAHVRTAFLAMAKPSLADVIREIIRLPVRRVVVQPHLLFFGRLLDRLKVAVQHASRGARDKTWIMTKHLGPSPLVDEAIIDRFTQALTRSRFQASSGAALGGRGNSSAAKE